ncbi:hypothetical protein KC19_12G005400 [Ceratodon purpureus]|uniref:Uncharacterized protein n=1 Tax=Ceratodon purpureus TaxID=3225 RepID=A0A8T0G371_CERPU|nr:hypothetical protein KC19_12G005400 [Ceratodon purpureus]
MRDPIGFLVLRNNCGSLIILGCSTCAMELVEIVVVKGELERVPELISSSLCTHVMLLHVQRGAGKWKTGDVQAPLSSCSELRCSILSIIQFVPFRTAIAKISCCKVQCRSPSIYS